MDALCGKRGARAELKDQRVTQPLILQPRVEDGLSAQDILEPGVIVGVDRFEAGMGLRYEIAREFAPYNGVEQEWRLRHSTKYARAAGRGSKRDRFRGRHSLLDLIWSGGRRSAEPIEQYSCRGGSLPRKSDDKALAKLA